MLNLINKFTKVAGYKIYMQNSVVFLNTSNTQNKQEVKKTIPLTITSIAIIKMVMTILMTMIQKSWLIYCF